MSRAAGSPLFPKTIPPGPRMCFTGALVIAALHLALWAVCIHQRGQDWAKALDHWDSAWYSGIIKNGYTDSSAAFFPLYPLCVKILSALFLLPRAPQFAGTVFSTLLFLGLSLLVGREAAREDPAPGLAPKSADGWLFFLLWPGSYVFGSHHTEALFLFLSWLAFAYASRGKTAKASIAAGLCALCRVQGGLVAVAAACMLAGGGKTPATRTRAFALSGLISLSFFALYPLYHYLRCQNALAFLSPHLSWTHPTATPAIFFGTFIMANPWQTMEFKWMARQFFALLMFGGALRLALTKQTVFAGYAAASLLLMPVQGEFANIFRFGAVLFPALFALGDLAREKLSWQVRALMLAGMLGLNLYVARDYILSRWAY